MTYHEEWGKLLFRSAAFAVARWIEVGVSSQPALGRVLNVLRHGQIPRVDWNVHRRPKDLRRSVLKVDSDHGQRDGGGSCDAVGAAC